MSKAKIAITLRKDLLEEIDRLVEEGMFMNRSQTIEAAVEAKLAQLLKTRLFQESRKLDPAEEKELAEESLPMDETEWPKY
ncbi:MAG: ribbon-helix-helix domain-containing protein [Candidatus Aminicenantes bacterium]|nr:ribbon-helix-helix domain-containing protein [Candidatus Aminicenantes bacterium]